MGIFCPPTPATAPLDVPVRRCPLVKYIKLTFKEHGCYFAPDVIQRCIDEATRKTFLSQYGIDELSELEKLAVVLLQDSAKYHGVSLSELAEVKKGMDDVEHTAS